MISPGPVRTGAVHTTSSRLPLTEGKVPMARRPISRRAFVLGASAGAASLVWWDPGLWTPRRAAALERTLATAAHPEGTTLLATIERVAGAGYQPLQSGPGWPTLLRTELAAARGDRSDRRRAVAAFAHLTDTHLTDAQSPGRVEFLDRYDAPYSAAFRAQETLAVQVLSSMVERINAIGRGPVTGRPLDCAVSTGDNIDNQQHNELAWFIAALDGGPVTPNSGDPTGYEGVQDPVDTDPHYWHPEGGPADQWRDGGFPEIAGLLDAAVGGFVAPGLDIPWYSTYGNHDGLVQGNLPRTDAIDRILTSGVKVTDLAPGQGAVELVLRILSDSEAFADEVLGGTTANPTRSITPDPNRRTVRTDEWVLAHLASPTRPGPSGHGYTDAHLELPALWYGFDIAPGVRGLSLDTGGFNSGSIGQTQLDWLEGELRAVHSRYVDAFGSEVRTGATDHLVVVFSHFNPRSMGGSLTDPANPTERRILGEELVAFLHRWPNIVAWVNGHHHTNEVTPYPDPSGRTGGFWDINTASHIDFPEHARLVELVDNADGTLSIICTMVDHAGPVTADHGDHSVGGLAAISRELSANDPQRGTGALGTAADLNVELVLAAPFDLRDLGTEPSTTTTSTTASTTTTTSALTYPARPTVAEPAFTG